MTTETAITSESLKEKTDKQLFRLAKKLGVRDISEETIERDDLINKTYQDLLLKLSESIL